MKILKEIFVRAIFLTVLFIIISFMYDFIKDWRLERKSRRNEIVIIVPRGEVKDSCKFNIKKHSDFADSLIKYLK